MPREFSRSERVSDAIQQEVSVLICDSIRDPRVGMASVTDVEVSRDLAYAKVHVTFVGEKSREEIEEAIRALNGAAGYLRKLLASSIKMRKTPQLNFLFDESGRRGQQLSALIDYAVSSEKNQGNIANDDSVDSKGN